MSDESYVVPVAGLARGTLNASEPGVTLGYYVTKDVTKPKGRKQWTIQSAGPIHLGISARVLGVVVGQRWAFLAWDGRLQRVPHFAFMPRIATISDRTREGLAAWADGAARRFYDKVVAPNENHAMTAANHRYRVVVTGLVRARVLDAARLGFEVAPADYARAVCATWTERDLCGPRYATIRHALCVCIVLALEAHVAAELVELAALLELRAPFVNREVADGMVRQTYSVTCHLCPAWSASGHLLVWARYGTVDALLRGHMARMLHGATARDVPLDAVAGIASDALTDAATMPEGPDYTGESGDS